MVTCYVLVSNRTDKYFTSWRIGWCDALKHVPRLDSRIRQSPSSSLELIGVLRLKPYRVADI